MVGQRRWVNIVVGVGVFCVVIAAQRWPRQQVAGESVEATPEASAAASPVASLSASPSPKPLSFGEMNALYGPCAVVPTLMYHHIEEDDAAAAAGHKWLSVAPGTFREQLEYLRSHGYTPIRPEQVVSFFDQGVSLPSKSVLLTFDDGYKDFATQAAPVLAEFGFPSILFLPTGLVENPDYVTWQDVSSLAGSGLVYFANHTWSHKSLTGTAEAAEREIGMADEQLTQHGLNTAKVFAYPYGDERPMNIQILQSKGYALGFTTKPGRILCKGQRLELPRVRIGNGTLSIYGF